MRKRRLKCCPSASGTRKTNATTSTLNQFGQTLRAGASGGGSSTCVPVACLSSALPTKRSCFDFSSFDFPSFELPPDASSDSSPPLAFWAPSALSDLASSDSALSSDASAFSFEAASSSWTAGSSLAQERDAGAAASQIMPATTATRHKPCPRQADNIPSISWYLIYRAAPASRKGRAITSSPFRPPPCP